MKAQTNIPGAPGRLCGGRVRAIGMYESLSTLTGLTVLAGDGYACVGLNGSQWQVPRVGLGVWKIPGVPVPLKSLWGLPSSKRPGRPGVGL